jgi:hypothetical protein
MGVRSSGTAPLTGIVVRSKPAMQSAGILSGYLSRGCNRRLIATRGCIRAGEISRPQSSVCKPMITRSSYVF